MRYENIKYELLIKAHIDISKMVRIIREDIVNGKPRWVHHWVTPDKVKPTDIVIAHHHNLPEGHPQRTSTSVVTDNKAKKIRLTQESKDLTNEYHQKFSSNEEFYAELNRIGITWKVTANPPIQLMRAKEALSLAIDKGFDPEKPTPIISTDTKKDTYHSDNTHIVISDSVKQAAKSFFEKTCKGDKDLLMKVLTQYGIDWSKNDDPYINYMNARKALNFAIHTGGFDPENPSQYVKPAKPPEIPSKDDTLLDVPSDATERDKILIKHINKMKDFENIKACARMGIVPEDSRAERYIVDKMQVEFAGAILNPEDFAWFREEDDNGVKHIPKELREEIIQTWGLPLLQRLSNKLPYIGKKPSEKFTAENFGKLIAEQLQLKGCKKSPISVGFSQVSRFNMGYLTDPRKSLSEDRFRPSLSSIFNSLNAGYSDYTTDDYGNRYLTNLGYTGYNSKEYSARYNVEKEGVVRYLRKIQNENPTLKDQADELVATYDEMMKEVGGDPYKLNVILNTERWAPVLSVSVGFQGFGKTQYETLPEVLRAINTADRLSNLVITELTKRGYSQENILKALQDSEVNDALDFFDIENNKGSIDTLDFTSLIDEKGNSIVRVSRGEHMWGKGLLLYTQAKYRQLQGLPLDTNELKDIAEYYNQLKDVANISEDTYKKVTQLGNKFFGLQYVDRSGIPLDWSTTDVTHEWKILGVKAVPTDSNPETDMIVSNLLMGKYTHDLNRSISSLVTNNKVSSFNKDGTDYSRNYEYYSGDILKMFPLRITQLGNDGNTPATYTASQLSAKIDSQLSAVPNYSVEYLTNLRKYYATTGLPANLDSFSRNWGDSTDGYANSPIKDVLYNWCYLISANTPETREKPTFSKLTAKRLDYKPFDFSKKEQPRLLKTKSALPETPPTAQEIREARATLLKSANCSLKTENEKTSREMWKYMTTEGFDYKRGETTPGGEVMSPVHSLLDSNGNRITTKASNPATKTINKVMLLNSPIFKVNNSFFEQNFIERRKKMLSEKLNSRCSDILELYTGTSNWSAGNIIGRDGQFYLDDDSFHRTGAMLGTAIYCGYKFGKVAPYACNDSYANQKVANPNCGQADGTVFLVSAMRGEKNYEQYIAASGKKNLTSVEVDALSPKQQVIVSGAIRDWEIGIKDNALVFPHHFCDISSRVINFNTKLDSSGYHDNTGLITHDTDGINVDIEWE